MDIQASLEALCSCPGPSGREEAVASQAMELLRPLMDEVKKDRFGNVIGIRRCGTENAKRVVLDAHLDEVGLVITGAKDGKISLSMKALTAEGEPEEPVEKFEYKETGEATTGLGALLKGLKF